MSGKLLWYAKKAIALPFALPVLMVIGALRLSNEVLCRTAGVAITICPYCGMPGMIETDEPYVVR